jgi:ligand-binding sensor domain-containing protein/DNA-binding CsgD family transcriptional regulator
LFSWVVLLTGSTSFSQNLIGQTEVKSFTRSQYGGGAQNWAMTQDKNSRLYIANNEGLLVFDGTNWQVYPVPNKTILRSIGFGPGGKLYVGAQDEIGYFASDEVGRLLFTSLKDRLPASERNFPDVWELEVSGSDVFFRTNAKLLKLNSEKFTIYPAPSNWLSLHKHQGRILAQDDKTGLMEYENEGWQPFIPKEELPTGFFVTDITPFNKDTSLLSTMGHGLYLLVQNKLLPYRFSNAGFNTLQHITSLLVINDSTFLIGTYFNGVYHLGQQGQVLENISTKNGLPNNTVRFVFDDKKGNAWAGLDNGLGFFSYNNPVSHINPPSFNNGAGYNATAYNGDLYFALSTGLQWLPLANTKNISSIANQPQIVINGLTWNVSVVNNQLLAGRDDGLWKINNKQAVIISNSNGYWAGKIIPGTAPQQVAVGNYTGIEKFTMVDGNFSSRGPVQKFTESSRYIETDDKNIWVSHPYRGIYKIDAATDAVSLFNKQNGLPADLDNHVFKIKNKIVFATSAGIYEYNAAENKMVVAKEYETLFGKLPVRYLKEDSTGNIWFVQEKMVGVADYNTDKPAIHYIPELKNKILSGFENIFPYNTNNILVGGETGFYTIDYEKYRESIKPFTAYITGVKTISRNDSVLFGGYAFDSSIAIKQITIPYKLNSLRFAYAASLLGQHSSVEFSYYLDGFDKGWSNWSPNAEKEYTNLPAGTYTFHVKARSSPSHESERFLYTFTIKSPWYETIWAYALYVLLAAALLYVILKYQSKRHQKKLAAKRLADQKQFEEEQKQMAYRHQLELEQSEKELIRLQKEKLEAEITHKNAELASATMNLVQKKEFILKLKTELQQLQKAAKVGDDNPELKKVLKALSEEEKLDEEWNNFSQHFNSVHGDFLIILKNKFPSLKPHEIRLCAYLRMNLSSKEIAPLMSISLRGVEISRYRLRKKLALASEVNLVQFLMDL